MTGRGSGSGSGRGSGSGNRSVALWKNGSVRGRNGIGNWDGSLNNMFSFVSMCAGVHVCWFLVSLESNVNQVSLLAFIEWINLAP
ncbi:hypothetical protein Q3G72_003006 [Acer saccharum]|nr:hypothetical protein Q3G72_003006 [Acer saccharum]